MKKLNVKTVLNMNTLSVSSKINKSRLIVDSISVNVGTFVTPLPDLITVNAAINDLETAWNEAADGGKTKTALMHDKEADLMVLMNGLASYVTLIADGDEEIVHLASMDTKKTPSKVQNEFDVIYGTDSGSVVLRKRSVKNASYIWEYSTDPNLSTSWVAPGATNQSKKIISGLTPGIRYWFRVSVIDKDGQHEPLPPISLMMI